MFRHRLRFAAAQLGAVGQAAMDHNAMACSIMRKNVTFPVLCGDVLRASDRAVLPSTPAPDQGILLSGFPRQPLSTQGDQRGALDPTILPFYAVCKAVWEHQSWGLVFARTTSRTTSSAWHGAWVLVWFSGSSLFGHVGSQDGGC